MDIWNEGLDLIRKNINKETYELWFKPTVFKSFVNGELNISVPNRYYGEWLKTNYYSMIKDTLTKLTQENEIKINFIPDKETIGAVKENEAPEASIEKKNDLFKEKGCSTENMPLRTLSSAQAISLPMQQQRQLQKTMENPIIRYLYMVA